MGLKAAPPSLALRGIDMREWIKCDEKWPETDVEVLVYSPDYDGEYYLAVWHEPWNEWHHCNGQCFPSHWQPLPEAP